MKKGLIGIAMMSQVFIGGAFALTSSAAAVADSIYSLVYTRQPRVQEQFANWQHWYDGGLPDRFTESDLVLDDMRGVVSVIHNCTTSQAICAAHDGRVSPDGYRIAYTLAEGNALYPVKAYATQILSPNIEFRAVRYSIWVYDTRTNTRVKVQDNARMPDWYSNNGLVFASNRAGIYTPWAYSGQEPGYAGKALQIYKATLTLNNTLANIVNLSPESVGAMNPVVLSNGNVCWSDYNGFGARSTGHTPSNMWWVKCVNGNGTNNRTVLGAHGSTTLKTAAYLNGIVDPYRRGEGATMLKLLRPLSEIKRGKYAVTNYYRSNHQGAMGVIFGISMGEYEGFSKSSNLPAADYPSTTPGSGRYLPPIEVLTPYGQDQDKGWPKFHLNGRAMGKAGFAAASPDSPYIFTQCRGACYEGTLQEANTRAAMGGEPTSKFEIRKALVRQVTDPFDPAQSVVIACAEEKWNCRDARYVAPYSALFGQAAPAAAPPPVQGAKTTLQVVNARAAELFPIPGSRNPELDKCAFQGCAEPDYAQRVTAIRIDRIFPWTTPPTRGGFARTAISGVFPLEADGSVKMHLRCGIVYQLSAVDAAGTVVAKDNSLHSTRCGEVVTCHGCHDGHSVERVFALGGKSAVSRFATTAAAKKP
jgi:hypothetical protein